MQSWWTLRAVQRCRTENWKGCGPPSPSSSLSFCSVSATAPPSPFLRWAHHPAPSILLITTPHCSSLILIAQHWPSLPPHYCSLLLNAPHCHALPLNAHHCPLLPFSAPSMPCLWPLFSLSCPHTFPLDPHSPASMMEVYGVPQTQLLLPIAGQMDLLVSGRAEADHRP